MKLIQKHVTDLIDQKKKACPVFQRSKVEIVKQIIKDVSTGNTSNAATLLWVFGFDECDSIEMSEQLHLIFSGDKSIYEYVNGRIIRKARP